MTPEQTAEMLSLQAQLASLVKEGLVEVLPATPARKRPNQYRRAQ